MSSPAASSSSGPATSPTSSRPGSRRSTGWRTNCGPAPRSPTSAAGSARPPSCSPSSTRTPGSPDLTTTTSRSRWPVSTPVTRESPTGSSFEVASASAFSGAGYDLVATFDCLHDMGDPLAAARHVRQALKSDGTWLIVEPAAADDVAGNMNPVGRTYYSFSTLLCVPNALSQSGGYALGAQAARPPSGRSSPTPVSPGSGAPPRPRSISSTKSVPSRPGRLPLVGWAVSTSW